MAFRNNAVAGKAGHAWLDIDTVVTPDVTFILSCPIRPASIYLGPNGWQGSAYEWKPLAVEGASAGTGARLQVGPQIVDRLQPDLLVRIEIPSAEYRADTHWDPVPFSGTPLYDPSVEEPAPEIDEPKAEPNEKIRPRNEKPRDEVQETSSGETIDKARVEISRRIEEQARNKLKAGKGAGSKGGRLISVAAAGAGLIAGMFLGWLYVSADLVHVAPRPPAISVASADEVIRLLASGEPQPERLYRAGTELLERPNGPRDVPLQAIRRAASLGYGPALLWLAQTADPVRPDWHGVRAKPDAASALDGYAAAIAAGSNEAAPMRIALCGYMRRVAQLTEAEEQAMNRYCH